jgi:hypothetical protein
VIRLVLFIDCLLGTVGGVLSRPLNELTFDSLVGTRTAPSCQNIPVKLPKGNNEHPYYFLIHRVLVRYCEPAIRHGAGCSTERIKRIRAELILRALQSRKPSRCRLTVRCARVAQGWLGIIATTSLLLPADAVPLLPDGSLLVSRETPRSKFNDMRGNSPVNPDWLGDTCTSTMNKGTAASYSHEAANQAISIMQDSLYPCRTFARQEPQPDAFPIGKRE